MQRTRMIDTRTFKLLMYVQIVDVYLDQEGDGDTRTSESWSAIFESMFKTASRSFQVIVS